MRGPTQALLWNAFSLSWIALLAQIAGVVGAVFMISLALDPGIDSVALVEATDLVLIVGISFTYLTTANRRQSRGRDSSSLGFPYRLEFSQPVSTGTLVFVPLFYFCALTQIALFVPATIVNILFLNIEISYFPIAFTIFQFTSFLIMLAWWTRNGLASLLSWLVTMALYLYGFLLPDFTRIEGTWIVTTDSAANYLLPLLCTAAMMGLAYAGVAQQRRGETLFQFGQGKLAQGEAGALRDLLPLPVVQCPTDSSLKAEIWKERQLNGESRAIFGGLVAACASLAILSIIDFFVPGESTVQLTNVMILALAMYGSVCIALMVSTLGVRYKNGVASVAVHIKTTPMSTLRLTTIKVSVSLLSSLVAGIVTFAVYLVLGPLLIEDFQEIQGRFLASFSFLTEAGILSGMLRATLTMIAFLTCLLLTANLLAWTMLQGKKMAIAYGLLCVYVFLLASGLTAFYSDGENLNYYLDTVFRGHLWIPTFLIPIGTVFMLRQLLSDEVINAKVLLWIVGIGGLAQGLNLIWLYSENHYDALNLDISTTLLSYFTMQGLLPMLAFVMALWTTNKIRHG